MLFRQIFEPNLAQYAYLIGCQRTGEAIIVDPQRDIDRYMDIAAKENVKIVAATETHFHADYLSGMKDFAERYGVKIYASDEGDKDWKYEWLKNSHYDYQLLKDRDAFSIGNIKFEAVHTPGHTSEHLCFLVTDKGGGATEPMGMLTGDFVFVGDVGRPDLLESAVGMEGIADANARILFKSIQRFKKLSPQIQIWPGHGAGSACGKALGSVPMSTVGYELNNNPSIDAASEIQRFVDYINMDQSEPPLYFSRMKRDNRLGPTVLENIPSPLEFSADKIDKLLSDKSVTPIDTRSWNKFRAGHLPGAICAPLNPLFQSVTGSYVEESSPVLLVIDQANLERAVLDLVRIGLDNFAGFVRPETIDEYSKAGGKLDQSSEVNASEFKNLFESENVHILDVRSQSEVSGTGALANAQNIAYTRLLKRINEVPKDKHVYTFCHTGARSAAAASLLESKGYQVTNVKGGYLAWAKAGGTMVKEKQAES